MKEMQNIWRGWSRERLWQYQYLPMRIQIKKNYIGVGAWMCSSRDVTKKRRQSNNNTNKGSGMECNVGFISLPPGPFLLLAVKEGVSFLPWRMNKKTLACKETSGALVAFRQIPDAGDRWWPFLAMLNLCGHGTQSMLEVMEERRVLWRLACLWNGNTKYVGSYVAQKIFHF